MVNYEMPDMKALMRIVNGIPGASATIIPGTPYIYGGRPTASFHVPYDSVDGEGTAATVRKVAKRHGELKAFSPEGNSTLFYRDSQQVGAIIFLGDAVQLMTPESGVLAVYREMLEEMDGTHGLR